MHNKTTNIDTNSNTTKEVDKAMELVQSHKRREQFKIVTTERKRTIHWG